MTISASVHVREKALPVEVDSSTEYKWITLYPSNDPSESIHFHFHADTPREIMENAVAAFNALIDASNAAFKAEAEKLPKYEPMF